MELTCPKCHGPMRTYERNGVHVDQCSECRGIFLDRGELERLMDAESEWNDQHAAPRAASSREGSRHEEARHEESRYEEPGHRDSRYEDQHRSSSGHGASAGSGAGLGAVVNEVLSQVRSSKSSSHGSSYGHGYPKKRKESFLGDLFG